MSNRVTIDLSEDDLPEHTGQIGGQSQQMQFLMMQQERQKQERMQRQNMIAQEQASQQRNQHQGTVSSSPRDLKHATGPSIATEHAADAISTQSMVDLREQILANAKVLFMWLRSEELPDTERDAPLHVVIRGSDTIVTAAVLWVKYGYVGTESEEPRSLKLFLEGPKANSNAEALVKLLQLTKVMMARGWRRIVGESEKARKEIPVVDGAFYGTY